jgi:chromatin remodeling complex protein RSC6
MFFWQNRHYVIQLPHHPDLDPIELIWSCVQEYFAKRNVTFKLDDTTQLIEEKLNSMNKQDWMLQCKEEYLVMEPVIDEMSDSIVVNADVDSETYDRDATASCGWNSGSEEEMSGIKPLSRKFT